MYVYIYIYKPSKIPYTNNAILNRMTSDLCSAKPISPKFRLYSLYLCQFQLICTNTNLTHSIHNTIVCVWNFEGLYIFIHIH